MAERGFAALPVVDAQERLLGIVAEVDVLRDRLPQDPRLHLRREVAEGAAAPALLVRGIMTQGVRSVDPTADVSDVARLFREEHVRSVPVADGDRLVGIVSRRDLLRSLARPDGDIRDELLRLVEGYTGDLDAWDVAVTEGVATLRRTHGEPQVSAGTEERALTELARTVGGVVAVRVLLPHDPPSDTVPAEPERPGTDPVRGGQR